MDYSSIDSLNGLTDTDIFLTDSKFDVDEFLMLNMASGDLGQSSYQSQFEHNQIALEPDLVQRQGSKHRHYKTSLNVSVDDYTPRSIPEWASDHSSNNSLFGEYNKGFFKRAHEPEDLITAWTSVNTDQLQASVPDDIMDVDMNEKNAGSYSFSQDTKTVCPQDFFWGDSSIENNQPNFIYEQPKYKPLDVPISQTPYDDPFSDEVFIKEEQDQDYTATETNPAAQPRQPQPYSGELSLGQKLINQQLQQSVKNGVYRKMDSHRGCNKDFSSETSNIKGVFEVPNNTAFLENGYLNDKMARDPIPQRRRYHRGKGFEIERQGYFLHYHANKDTIYDPEYTLVKMSVIDGTSFPDNKTREALCPYCKEIKFFLLKDSAYGNHMATDHGILTDSYITPDPFKSSKPTASKGRNVTCPVCVKDIVVAKSSATARTRPLYSYLRHFKYEHQKADKKGCLELDRFKRMKFSC